MYFKFQLFRNKQVKKNRLLLTNINNVKFLKKNQKKFIIIIIINQLLYKSTMQQQPQKNKQQSNLHNQNIFEQQILIKIQKSLQKQQKQQIQSIRSIKNNQVDLQLNQKITQQIKIQNINKIKQITSTILIIQQKLRILSTIKLNSNQLNQKNYYQLINKNIQNYEPSKNQIDSRYHQLIIQPNDSNWTDASQSQADDDQIWVVDDEIVKAMQQQSQQQIQQQLKNQQINSSSVQNKENKKQQQLNIQQLEQQFITGQQSDHLFLLGKHSKFCVSVNGNIKNNFICSGGGDDYLYMYNFPKDNQYNSNQCYPPYHKIKHTQTINKIQISFSKQYIFTMTDNQILCTQIKTKITKPLKIKQKIKISSQPIPTNTNQNQQKQSIQSQSENQQPICTDMVCHHLGDVIAISSGYQLQIFNIKGLKLYQTYYSQKAIDLLAFTQTGKQIVMACQDHKLRLLTPKTSQIINITGMKQHKSQISVIKTKGDIILSGCIDGYIGVTTIKKSTIATLIGTQQSDTINGPINQIQFAGSYFIVGSTYNYIDWYDLSKTKKLFQSPTQGSPSDICWQSQQYQYLYNISTIKGLIHVYDCRNPLKEVAKAKAGNTVHKLWCESYRIAAACQDGYVRLFDIRKLL